MPDDGKGRRTARRADPDRQAELQPGMARPVVRERRLVRDRQDPRAAGGPGRLAPEIAAAIRALAKEQEEARRGW